MTITGAYKKDANFTTIYTADTMYQIARNTGEWSYVKVNDRLPDGHILTPELFQEWKAECIETGTFELSEE